MRGSHTILEYVGTRCLSLCLLRVAQVCGCVVDVIVVIFVLSLWFVWVCLCCSSFVCLCCPSFVCTCVCICAWVSVGQFFLWMYCPRECKYVYITRYIDGKFADFYLTWPLYIRIIYRSLTLRLLEFLLRPTERPWFSFYFINVE